MIKVYSIEEALIKEDAWDFSLNELDYLLQEHRGESFVLVDDRLWEAEEVF